MKSERHFHGQPYSHGRWPGNHYSVSSLQIGETRICSGDLLECLGGPWGTQDGIGQWDLPWSQKGSQAKSELNFSPAPAMDVRKKPIFKNQVHHRILSIINSLDGRDATWQYTIPIWIKQKEPESKTGKIEGYHWEKLDVALIVRIRQSAGNLGAISGAVGIFTSGAPRRFMGMG